MVKQQLLILNRSRHRVPNLRASDRILAGECALFMRPARVIRSAIVLRPSTILDFHRILRHRKYQWRFSPRRRRTGPKGPSKALVDAIVEMKRRNPTWGCPRIAQQIGLTFDIQISTGPGRERPLLADVPFLGHTKDTLWSIDLFRCESAILRRHWVLVVMDQYTRRIIGLGVHAGIVDGRALCRMFNHAVASQDFYNAHRAYASLKGRTPVPTRRAVARLDRYRWQAHCRGLYQKPIAA